MSEKPEDFCTPGCDNCQNWRILWENTVAEHARQTGELLDLVLNHGLEYLHRRGRYVAQASSGNRNASLNAHVYHVALSDCADKETAYECFKDACKVNGYIFNKGISAFEATFESAWDAGLERSSKGLL